MQVLRAAFDDCALIWQVADAGVQVLTQPKVESVQAQSCVLTRRQAMYATVPSIGLLMGETRAWGFHDRRVSYSHSDPI